MKTKTASQIVWIRTAEDFTKAAAAALSGAEEPVLAARIRALGADIAAARARYVTISTALSQQAEQHNA